MLDSTLQSSRSKPLLPNEPRIINSAFQQLLTDRYLTPNLLELERYFLAVRESLDSELSQLQPVKLGKAYPLGQCLEIAVAIHKRLREVKRIKLPPQAIKGFDAMRAFLRDGGSFRQVWGDLRGQYFQNAFQLGTLYLDVANDTVVATKPKIEILPFDQANIVPIRDFEHFIVVAQRYWKDEIYPNHVLPGLAPYCPLIHMSKDGAVRLHDASQYMIGMTLNKAYEPSETVLRAAPMPQDLFEAVREALKGTSLRTASNPERGRREALRQCQQYRAKRWHQNAKPFDKIILEVQQSNLRFSQFQFTRKPKEIDMATVKIDDKEYEADSLSEEANTQLQNLRFVDQELARLQGQAAVLQTARTSYANALKAALPKDK